MRSWPLLGFLLATNLLHGSAPAPKSASFRDVRVHVVDVQGRLAAHRKVDLIGLERWSLEPYHEKENSNWHFITDKDGYISVPIGDFAGWLNNEVRPGWGVYALVVEAGANDAGGVSARFWFDNKPGHMSDPNTENWAPEWGRFVYLPSEGLNLTIPLVRGFTLQGRVVDDQNLQTPVAGAEIVASNDLHADTHAGGGGEILGRSAITDAQGCFVFQNLYPQTVYLNFQALDDKGPATWLRTQLDGKWVDEVGDKIEPPASGIGTVKLEIGAALSPHFRYFGRVTDAAGKPVSGACVCARRSLHPNPSAYTFEDEHGGTEATTTNADGSYAVMVATPWVRAIEVWKLSENRSTWPTLAGEPYLPPGHYDLKFRSQ